MFGDLGRMMALAGKLKTELPKMKRRLAESEFTADAGGGAVRATVNGRMQIVELEISPEPAGGDVGALADLIKSAVAAAQEQAAQAARDALMELTGGINLPGMEDMF